MNDPLKETLAEMNRRSGGPRHGLGPVVMNWRGDPTPLGGNEFVTGDRHSGFTRFASATPPTLDVSISGDAISVRATLTSAADAKRLIAVVESSAAALFDKEPKS